MLMPSSKQSNGYDCGPYALAFATALLIGHDPSQLEFNAGKIRKHAMQCLITGEISSFPTKKLKLKHDREPITYKFPVYCVCRLTARLSNPSKIPRPFTEEHMVQCSLCSEWFHRVCLDDGDDVMSLAKRKKWSCPSCESQ